MNLKKINEKEVLKSLEKDNFSLDTSSEFYTNTANRKILPYKNKDKAYGFIKIEKVGGKILIDAFQEFEDKEFKDSLLKTTKKIEETLKEKTDLIENLFREEKEFSKKEIQEFLNGLKKENEKEEKYIAKGENITDLLLELKELGYIEKLYSSDINEVTVQFKKTSSNFKEELEKLGLKLKKFEKLEQTMTLQQLLTFANVERIK